MGFHHFLAAIRDWLHQRRSRWLVSLALSLGALGALLSFLISIAPWADNTTLRRDASVLPSPAATLASVVPEATLAQPSLSATYAPTRSIQRPGLPALVDALELFVVKAEGGEPTLLHHGPGTSLPTAHWSPDGGWLAFAEADQVYLVKPGEEKKLVRKTEGPVRHLAWSPEGGKLALASDAWLYVANRMGDVVLAQETPGTFKGLLWAPDGDLLAMVTKSPQSEVKADAWRVSLIRPEVGSSVSEIYRDVIPEDSLGLRLLAWPRPGSRLLAITQEKLLLIELATRAVTDLGSVIPPRQDWLLRAAVSPDGSQVAVAVVAEDQACQQQRQVTLLPYRSSLVLLQLADASPKEVVRGRCGYLFPAWSPDGSQIAYMAVGEETGIYLLDVASGAARRLSQSGSCGDLTWLADGSGLAAALGRCHSEGGRYLFVPVQDGREQRLNTRDDLLFFSFGGFAPDSRRYLYSDDAVRVGILGSGPRVLTEPDPANAFSLLQWSPKGDWVTYLRHPGFSSRRYAVHLETGQVTRLPPSKEGETTPSPDKSGWSSDGKRHVQEVRDKEGNLHLAISELEGGQWRTRQLTQGPYINLDPSWSPDGRAIAFWRHLARGGTPWIELLYLVWPDTGREQELARFEVGGGFVGNFPRWSPDGRQLAVYIMAGQRGQPGIYLVSVEEVRVTHVVATGGRSYTVAWSEDGRQLLVTSVYYGL